MRIPCVLIDWDESSLWWAVCCIIFNPLYWNIIARWEHKTHGLTSICGSRMRGVTLLAATILLLGIYRDVQFNDAIKDQPRWSALQDNYILWGGYFLLLIGTILVFSSFYQLGFAGTFLGDYFGIYFPHKVKKFPFNILENPMYVGSTLNFFAIAIVKCSQAGIFLAIVVGLVYNIAVQYEGPFTAEIYNKRARCQSLRESWKSKKE